MPIISRIKKIKSLKPNNVSVSLAVQLEGSIAIFEEIDDLLCGSHACRRICLCGFGAHFFGRGVDLGGELPYEL